MMLPLCHSLDKPASWASCAMTSMHKARLHNSILHLSASLLTLSCDSVSASLPARLANCMPFTVCLRSNILAYNYTDHLYGI